MAERTVPIGVDGLAIPAPHRALIPILSTIAITDAAKIAAYLNGEFYSLAGYLVRVVALFLLGALWVYVDSSITTKRKALEIGLVAPALISAWLSAANVTYERSGEIHQTMRFEVISSAFAQDQPEDQQQEQIDPFQQFIKGILGR